MFATHALAFAQNFDLCNTLRSTQCKLDLGQIYQKLEDAHDGTASNLESHDSCPWRQTATVGKYVAGVHMALLWEGEPTS